MRTRVCMLIFVNASRMSPAFRDFHKPIEETARDDTVHVGRVIRRALVSNSNVHPAHIRVAGQ